MGEFLTKVKGDQKSIKGLLGQSFKWLKRQIGNIIDDDEVDDIVRQADELTDLLEPIVANLLAKAVPVLPEAAKQVVAAQCANILLQQVDVIISAAGAVVKKHNDA